MASLLVSNVARAEYCRAKPNSVIVHDSQIVYFTAEGVCPDWCQLRPAWSDVSKDRAFSLLTTAIVQDRPLVFFFPNGCGRQPVYSEPDDIIMTREP